MTAYLETLLMREERILYVGELHWVIFVPSVIFTCLGWALAHYDPVQLLWRYGQVELPYPQMEMGIHYLVMFMVVIGVGMLFEAYMRRMRTELVITNRRVMVKTGIVSRHTIELFLSKVEGANVEQGIMGRMLGYGSIHVKGTGAGMTPIDNIVDPDVFQRVLLEGIRRRQDDDDKEPAGANRYAKND